MSIPSVSDNPTRCAIDPITKLPVDFGRNMDHYVAVDGYYRYQEDNQIVICRSPEQQRVFDEYFVVKNYRTATCDSKLWKYANLFKIIGIVASIVGVLVMIVSLVLGGTSSRDGISQVAESSSSGGPNVGLILGGAVAVCGIVSLVVSAVFKKKFKDSIHVSVAPNALLSDAEYEALVLKKAEEMDIAHLGLQKLGLTEDQVREIQPIVLSGKVVKDFSLTVYNKDTHAYHSSTHYVTYLYFTDDQLFVYKVRFDMCCNMQDEWTSEFFYRDICDVSSHTYRNVLTLENYQFEYSTMSFTIITTNSSISFEMDAADHNVESIQAMKRKIREKKNI